MGRETRVHTADELEHLWRHLWPHTGRMESRRRCFDYVGSLLDVAAKHPDWFDNGAAADEFAANMPEVLLHTQWDADEARDRLQAYLTGRLGNVGKLGAIVETGAIRRENAGAPVSGTSSALPRAGERLHAGLLLAYAVGDSIVTLDRACFVPSTLADDPARCRAAGVPPDNGFRSKPELGQEMLVRAAAGNISFGWITCDPLPGSASLRGWLETRDQPYVFAVKPGESLATLAEGGVNMATVDDLVATVPDSAWATLVASRADARPFDWAVLPLPTPSLPDRGRWLIMQRDKSCGEETTTYVAFAAAATPLTELAAVVLAHHAAVAALRVMKETVGLMACPARGWTAWHRHVTLAMLACAVQSMTAHADGADASGSAQRERIAPLQPIRSRL